MDKLHAISKEPSHGSLSRESTLTMTPTTATELHRSRQTSQTSAASSINASPLPSRESSPSRPSGRNSASKASFKSAGSPSRKNSQQDLSPTRSGRLSISTTSSTSKILSAANTPTLLPCAAEPNTRVSVPFKSSTFIEQVAREPPRWPVSPRLRSPPPILNKPSLPPPRRAEQDGPVISLQRATPSQPDVRSDADADDAHLQPGTRTPLRGAGGSSTALETVQEASPLSSPKAADEMEEKLPGSIISMSSSHPDQPEAPMVKRLVNKASLMMNESGSESGSLKAARRSGATSAPSLTARQSSASVRPGGIKGKAGECSLQSMTVETETVNSIPQVTLASVAGTQGPNGSLRTKPSSETIRPKREKKKAARKQPSVTSGIASSKADVFEAKVASAVEEANSSDSEETFVYDSNPPDGRDRPQRFHSRTPSATSMVSQIDRNGMRSIHTVIEGGVPAAGVKKNMKFVNSYSSNGNEGLSGDDDGKGTGRSVVGSARVSRHHHIGRWGRNGGNGHPSLFADESPFSAPLSTRFLRTNSRQTSAPTSPRLQSGRGAAVNGKRGSHSGNYDLDDTNSAVDEITPLMSHNTLRSSRPGRNRRHVPSSLGSLDHQSFRSQQPSVLNRFASCLVLTVMLLLVVSGAIGFMFATSQPLQELELVSMSNVVASEQELILDLTVRAHNPNVMVVVVDAANIEVFAKSPHAGQDSDWWRQLPEPGSFVVRRKDFLLEPPSDDSAPNMRLGSIKDFDSPLSFEGSFFHHGMSKATGEVRLIRPGNGTDGGSERWERIIEDEFDLVMKGVLKYSLPLSQNVRSVQIAGRTTVKPNATLKPNGTELSDLASLEKHTEHTR